MFELSPPNLSTKHLSNWRVFFIFELVVCSSPVALILLWQAQGNESKEVKGFYGWGITIDCLDDKAQRIPFQYVERWVSKYTIANETKITHAPIPADDVLTLSLWQHHLLKVMPVGTNFLVSDEQLQELDLLVQERFPESQFHQVVLQDLKRQPVDPSQFHIEIVPLVEGKE